MRCLLVIALWLVVGSARAADEEAEDNLGAIVVTATRIPTLIRDEALRIEAVPAEEIEENLTVQPGNLSSLLNELPGVRAQPAASGLGGAGLQLRGMPERHTLILTDGLPLLGAESGSFGLLQTPPLDLAQVEVIKGAASALYGGSALGGVLNLVSNTAAAESVLLGNASSQGGRDLVGFFSAKSASAWSGTLTAGAHDQSREDIDGDGWANLPGYRRYTLRPRLWWNGGKSRSLFFTAGIMNESREGGTLPGRVLPSGTEFRESQHTRRLDGSAVGHWALASGLNFNGRASLTRTTQDHMFDAERVASTQSTVYAEGAWNNQWDGHSWVLGLAFQHSALSAAAAPGVSYAYDVPALFVQDEFSAATWLSFAVSARVDVHNRYGTFQSARLSALLRQPGGEWSLRASVGNGFAAPTAFVEQVEATGLGALLPLRGLQAERAVTASLDAKWADAGWDLNLSVFTSEIRHPLQVNSIADRLQLANSPGTRRAPGAEALVGYVAGPLHFIASYSYIAASEIAAPGVRQDVPNMPRHSAEIAAILENDKRGRIGLELGYTGRQRLTDNPYRSVSRSYFELSALGEIRFGSVAVFLNAINLTDMRQTHNDPLVRPTLGPGGNPITDVWAPIDGRTFNLGVRVAL